MVQDRITHAEYFADNIGRADIEYYRVLLDESKTPSAWFIGIVPYPSSPFVLAVTRIAILV